LEHSRRESSSLAAATTLPASMRAGPSRVGAGSLAEPLVLPEAADAVREEARKPRLIGAPASLIGVVPGVAQQALEHPAAAAFRGRRIAIFEPYPDFATNPTLVGLCHALTEAGARVDVLMPRSGRFPSGDGLAAGHRFPYRIPIWRGDLRRTLRGWGRGLQELPFRRQVNRLFARGSFDLIVGVDSDGIVEGHRYAQRFGLPLAYLSFEIFFWDELGSPYERRRKARESEASRAANPVIIQDAQRAQLLAAENDLEMPRFAYLPVSPTGVSPTGSSDFLRTRFEIPEAQTIVLHSGGFGDETYAQELLESAAAWPADFVLVIHTKYRPGQRDPYVELVRDADLPNVILSTEPLPAEEYESMVASADLGLVLYKTIPGSLFRQKNIECIGLSSGKFSYYLKHGLPVVSIGQQTYADLLGEYEFGENLSSFDEMPGALARIRSRHEWHSAEAKRLFSERLDFDVHWPTIAARFQEVMA
jgi:hypothetical protein